MKTVQVMNFERTKKELVTDFDVESFKVDDTDEVFNVDFDVSLIRPAYNETSYNLIECESIIIYDGQEFVIKQCTESASGSVCTKSVTAIHIFHTIQDGYQYDVISGVKSINECLTHIFKADKQGFKYEVVNTNGIIGRVEQENFGNANLLKLIDEVMKDYDVTVVKDNKKMTFYPNEYFSKKTNNQIRYLFNTDSVSFSIDTLNFKTQIKGSGKRKDPPEGKEVGDWYFEPIIYTSPQAKKWGVRIQDSIEDERYTVKANMIDRLKRELHDYFEVSGKVSLKELDFGVKRGDLIRFIYEPLKINQWIKVVGVTDYPFSNKTAEIELDTSRKTMLDYVVALMKGVKR